MKRLVFKLVVFLLLGVVVNVAVAWGCVYWSPFPRIGLSVDPRSNWAEIDPLSAQAQWLEERGWPVTRRLEPPIDPMFRLGFKAGRYEIQQSSRSTFGLERIEYSEWYSGLRFDDNSTGLIQHLYRSPFLARIRAGWPLLALDGDQRAGVVRSGRVLTWQFGIAVPRPAFDKPNSSGAILPLRPLWPGFAINTVFYAVILWLIAFGPFAARRIVRRRRGHCPQCGYDLRGAEHEVCPECGVEV